MNRIKPGLYTEGDAILWREGEGPDAGLWIFDLGHGNGPSEPYMTKREAEASMRAAMAMDDDTADAEAEDDVPATRLMRGDTVWYNSPSGYANGTPGHVTHVNPDGTATVSYAARTGQGIAFGVPASQLTPRFT